MLSLLLIFIIETPFLFIITRSELVIFTLLIEIIYPTFKYMFIYYCKKMLYDISRIMYSDKFKYLFTILFIIVYIVYVYFCLKLMPFNSITYNFNLYNNASKLYYYSDNRWKLLTAALLLIVIPCITYTFKIIFAFIVINYKVILYILLGTYTTLITRRYIIYKELRYKNYCSKFDIVDMIYLRIISLIIIPIFSLFIIIVLGSPCSVISINIFVFASYGIILNINNTCVYWYYKYKTAKLPFLPECEINEYQNIWVILSIFLRYISINILVISFTLYLFILLLIILIFYIIHRDKLNKHLSYKSVLFVSLGIVIFCIVRGFTIYIQLSSNGCFDIINWLDNNNTSSNSVNQNNTNYNYVPRRLSDLPEINFPTRPLIPSISNINSPGWNEVSSIRGTRNSSINNMGINYNVPTLNIDRQFQCMHLYNRDNAGRGIINNLSNPIPFINQSTTNASIVSGNNTNLDISSNISNSNLNLTWEEPIICSNNIYIQAPTRDSYEKNYHLRNGDYYDSYYEVRFNNTFASDYYDGDATAPVASDPIPGFYIEDVPPALSHTVVPELERVPSPFRKITTDEFWDRIHGNPLRKDYLRHGDVYFDEDVVPAHVRLKIFFGYVLHEPVSHGFAWSDRDLPTERAKYSGTNLDNCYP